MTSKPGTTERSDDEFKQFLVRLQERLGSHTASLHAGRLSATDDLAAVLRTLLTRGAGDDVVRKAIKRFSLQEPIVLVSAPITRQRNLKLAFGALPVGIDDSGDEHTNYVGVLDWINSLALSKEGLHREYYTWAQLITAYANTNGSHLSRTVPDVLHEVVVDQVGEVDLGVYLIWCAAVLADEALRDVIQQLGMAQVDPATPPLLAITWMMLSVNADQKPNLRFIYHARNTGPMLTLNGPHPFQISTTLDPDGTNSLHIARPNI
ncbi:hypothetical protein [Aeromicrobium sp.]|uniref:hypothetical protein n=1 Tax=Aeromicrobium sp. TaxID=1871063 RepID=UPI0030C0F814